MNFRLCVLLLFVLALTSTAPTAEAKVSRGDRAPAFVNVVNSANKSVSLKTYKDRIVVLTFGASWCAPCKKELPAFEKLASTYDAKKVTFLAINIDKDIAKGKAFMKKAGLKNVVALFDPHSATVETYQPQTMPTTFLMKRGVVKHIHTGFRAGDEKNLKKLIDGELK